MRFLNFLNESKKIILTIRDLEKLSNKSYLSNDVRRNVDFLIDYWYETSKKEVAHFLKTYSNVANKVLKILGKVPYYDKNSLISSLLSTDYLPEKESDLFPVPVYISANPNDKNTIGILIHENGKKELFEGNDEASNETYELVDKIIGEKKPIRVYGYHGEKVVEKIRKTMKLPKNLYMSPSKQYALGYWSTEEKRIPFSVIAMTNDFRKESDYDWKTKKEVKIKNFRYL